MKFFDTFRAVLAPASEPPTAGRLAGLLDEARRELSEAERRRDKLEAGRAEALLAGETERLSHRQAIAEAVADIADAEEAVRLLAARLTETEANEAEAIRRQRYDAADAQAAAAAKRLRADYVKHARALADLIRLVAEADLAVEQANADRPADAVMLDTAEGRARDIPGQPRQALRETLRHLWAGPSGKPVADQSSVNDIGRGRGVINVPAPSDHVYASSVRVECDRHLFRETEFLPELLPLHGARLCELTLPGLRAGEPDFFSPTWTNSPASVLDRLDQLASEAPAARSERAPVVEHARVAEDLAEAAE